MDVGEVRVSEDADFARLKSLCTCNDSWKQEYNKSGTTVWTKTNDASDFKMVKVKSVFKDIAAVLLYDVLHDPQYRKLWDSNMIEAYEICCLNPNNDIGYYALKAPKPLKNRDFVTQRSWLDTGREYYIINHSVHHSSLPQKKGFIRGISYITGYYLVPLDGERCDRPGCVVTYVTQADPKGKLPAWAVNKVMQILAPKVMTKIHKACKEYDKWKAEHNPNHKPWLFPEQITLPRLNFSDIGSMKETQQAEAIDETGVEEELIKEDFLDVKPQKNSAVNGGT